MSKPVYVPLVLVTVTPHQNVEQPNIEKTERKVKCPVYQVALFEEQWGNRAKVTSKPITDDTDKLWEVPVTPGSTACDSEIKRLITYFKSKQLFKLTYPRNTFRDEFNRVAVNHNPAAEARAAREVELQEAIMEKAASGLMKAAEGAARTIARKNAKPGDTPTKVKGGKTSTPATETAKV